jgi:hypothetical protein
MELVVDKILTNSWGKVLINDDCIIQEIRLVKCRI